jgi:hypothetical protein
MATSPPTRHPLRRLRAWWSGDALMTALRMLSEAREALLYVQDEAEVETGVAEVRSRVQHFVRDADVRAHHLAMLDSMAPTPEPGATR